MILVTGGTGFIGRALIRHLSNLGKPVRMLLRPSKDSPTLPRGVGVEVAVSSLKDERGLRAAMKGVDVVYHLAGTERSGSRADLSGVDIEGTHMLADVAAQAGVNRLLYLSHLGADRASAFPVLKAKAIAEGFIQRSGVEYTILRTAAVFGPGDQFTTSLVSGLRRSPGIFVLPAGGKTVLQPLWVDDLVTCLDLASEDVELANQLHQIGGGEYLSFREIVKLVMEAAGVRRRLVSLSPAYLRMASLYLDQGLHFSPISIFWIDYLATDRTCPVDALPRLFGLMPARFAQQLTYLKVPAAAKRRFARKS